MVCAILLTREVMYMGYNLFGLEHRKINKTISELEQEEMQLSSDIFYCTEKGEENLNPHFFLYHGIRFDDNMKKLEKIFLGVFEVSKGTFSWDARIANPVGRDAG